MKVHDGMHEDTMLSDRPHPARPSRLAPGEAILGAKPCNKSPFRGVFTPTKAPCATRILLPIKCENKKGVLD